MFKILISKKEQQKLPKRIKKKAGDGRQSDAITPRAKSL